MAGSSHYPENDFNGDSEEGNEISMLVSIGEEPATEHLLDSNTSSKGASRSFSAPL